MKQRILVIEDEEDLQMMLTDRLDSVGYSPECVADGVGGLEKAMQGSYDLIILDVMLPNKNGLDVCRALRAAGSQVPVIMLTASGQLVDKVLGLKLGADDYLTKPFEMLELLARIEALLRHGVVRPADLASVYHLGPIRVDVRGTTVSCNGQVVPVTAREFRLLCYFARNPGITLSREVLLKNVWGYCEETFTAEGTVRLLYDSRKPPITRLFSVT
jgi:two-component system, OmpR family, alkaline phosphatase synthesis response regulator PhoP